MTGAIILLTGLYLGALLFVAIGRALAEAYAEFARVVRTQTKSW